MITKAKRLYVSLEERYPAHSKLGRYLISGGTAAAINVAVLFACVHWLHIWYITSSIVSFVISFIASFTFQKFWTFKDKATLGMHRQAVWYLCLALVNLGLNTLIVYFCVETAAMNYIVAQIVASALVACESFFISRLIFKASSAQPTLSGE